MKIQVQLSLVVIPGHTLINGALPFGFGVSGDGPVYSIGYRGHSVATAKIEDGLILISFEDYDLAHMFRENLVEKWSEYGTTASLEMAIPLHEVNLDEATKIACALPEGFGVTGIGPDFTVWLRGMQVASARIVPDLLPVVEFDILEDALSLQLRDSLLKKYKALFLKV